jgi:hypothetical protein
MVAGLAEPHSCETLPAGHQPAGSVISLAKCHAVETIVSVRYDDVSAVQGHRVLRGRGFHGHGGDQVAVPVVDLDPELVMTSTRLVVILNVDEELVVADGLLPTLVLVGALAGE